MSVNSDQVKRLMGLPVSGTGSPDIGEHLRTADLIVTEDLATAGHSTERLDQICLYLAAHFVEMSINSGGLKVYKVGDSLETYEPGKPGEGYFATRYGRQAMAFDTSGILAQSGTPTGQAAFRVV